MAKISHDTQRETDRTAPVLPGKGLDIIID
jgi:hypothetical protein